jgi:hypothetical protein
VEAASLPTSVLNEYHLERTGVKPYQHREREAKSKSSKKKRKVADIDVESTKVKSSTKARPPASKKKSEEPEKKERLERKRIFRGTYNEDRVEIVSYAIYTSGFHP